MRHGFACRNVVLLLSSKVNACLGTPVAGIGRREISRLSLMLFLMSFLLATSAGPVLAQQNVSDWSVVGDLVAARSNQTATVLNDGRVLIAGGQTNGGASNVAEIFDPATNTTRATGGTMSVARANHAAVLLQDGRVLLVGGENSTGALASAEIYDPKSDVFTPVGSMSSARRYLTATVINDETVVILGGEDINGNANASIESFQVSTGEFVLASARLDAPRAQHTATLLLDGRIFIAGGRNGNTALASTSFYDPATDTLKAGPKLDAPRYAHTATRVLYGDVVLAGGTQDGTSGYDTVAVLYRDGTMGVAANKLSVARFGHVTLELANSSNLLVLGGRNETGPVAAVDYMDPESFTFKAAPFLLTPRSEFVAFSGNGHSCVAGGNSSSGPIGTIESARYPSVKSDRSDYPPNTRVMLTGSGWSAGESVTLNIRESDGDQDTNLVATADDQGNFSNSDFVTKNNDAHVAFLVKAVGQDSQRTAYTKFTDLGATITLDPAQLPASNNPFTLKIIGVGFTLGQNTVYVQGVNLGSGTTVSDTEIDVTVPASLASVQGSYDVYVSQLYTYTTTCCTQQCYSCNPYCCGVFCMSTCWNTCCNPVCNPCQQQTTYNTNPATLTVLQPLSPPTISKVFGTPLLRQGGTTSLTFTVTNPNTSGALSGIAFADNFPPGLIVAGPNNLNNTCGGMAMAPVSSNYVSLSGVSLAQSASCTLSVDVTGTTPGMMSNVTTQVNSNEGGTGDTASANITVVTPPSLAESFSPTTVPVDAPSTLTFSITNGNSISVNASFGDTLPANLVVAATPNILNNCGGTVTAIPGSSNIRYSNSSLAAGTCSVAVNVIGTTDGVFSNSITIDSTDAGSGNTASADLTVINSPSITKAFGAPTIPLNGTTPLTFTVTNSNVNTTLQGVNFTDTLPAGIVVATPNSLNTDCLGSPAAVAGSSAVSLSGSIVAHGSSCTMSVNVSGTTAGVKNNSVQVTSSNAGAGNTSNASVTVVAPPSIVESFGAASIPLNSTTSLNFTINNPNATATLTGIGFSDILPSGLVVATPSGITGSCGAGTISAAAGTNIISLSAGSIAARGACTFSVSVIGVAVGKQDSTTGNVTSTEGGTGGTASASTTISPLTPTVAISAAPAGPSAVNTSVTFTASLSGVTLTPVAPSGSFTFAVNGTTVSSCTQTVSAAGIATCTVSSLPAGSNTVTATYSGDTNYLASAPGSTSYTVNPLTPSVSVTAFPASSSQVNSSVTFTASLSGVMLTPITPSGTFAFAANGTTIPGCAALVSTGGTATCTTYSLPAGTITVTATYSGDTNYVASGPGNTSYKVNALAPTVVLAAVPASPSTLNTSVTFTASLNGVALTPVAPSGSFGFAANGAPIPGCTAKVISAGTATCTVASLPAGADTVTATYSGDPNYVAAAPGSTDYTVNPLAPTVSVTASPASPSQVNTSVTFTASLGGVTLMPVVPSGIFTFAVNGTTVASCTQTVSVAGVASCSVSSLTAGTDTITVTYSGDTNYVASAPGVTQYKVNALTPTVVLAAAPANSAALNTSVTFTASLNGVTLTPVTPSGTFAFAANGTTIPGCAEAGVSAAGIARCTTSSLPAGTDTITATYSGDANYVASVPGSANYTVVAPPSIAQVFNPTPIALNATSSLTFTITNPAANTTGLAGVAFTETLPTGIAVVNASATVCGGTLTTAAPSGIVLTGASVAVNGQCQFSVTVTGAASGQYTSTTGNVTSTNGGTGNKASAVLSVASPPTITTAFGAATIPLGGATSLTFRIANPNGSVALTGLAFTDNLPAGLEIAPSPNLTNSCGGTLTAVAGSNSATLAGGTLAVDSACTISMDVQGTTSGAKNNTSGAVGSNESGPGSPSNSATLAVLAPPVILDSFGAESITLGGSTSLTFSISNPNPGYSLTGVAFSNVLPSGLVVSTPNGLTGTCGGTIIGAVGANDISLAGATLAASGSCTLSVNVTGIHAGTQVNTTGNVMSVEGGTGGPATASVVVNQASTTTTLSLGGTKHFGETATFIATVNSPASTPTGTVAFLDGTTILGTATLGSGTATFSTTTLSLGTHSITAQYQGSSDYVASVSEPATQEVIAPLITVSSGSTSMTVRAGQSGVVQLALSSAGTLSAPVTLTCSGLPVGSECMFSPLSVGPENLPAQVTLTVTTTRLKIVGQNRLSGLPWTFAVLFPGLFILPFGAKRKWRWPWVALGLALLLVLTLAVGCGSGNSGITNVQESTTPGSYTVVITATSTGATQSSTSFSLTVTR
jgi:hypothetical protein